MACQMAGMGLHPVCILPLLAMSREHSASTSAAISPNHHLLMSHLKDNIGGGTTGHLTHVILAFHNLVTDHVIHVTHAFTPRDTHPKRTPGMTTALAWWHLMNLNDSCTAVSTTL